MREVVVLGAQGMLAQAYRRTTLHKNVTFLTKDECDITQPEQLNASIPEECTVVNLSAYTKVDDAESHAEQAFRVNAEGVKNLAEVATSKGARIVHISTDYVFDGTQTAPYGEEAPGRPQTVYGQSKWQGEQYLREIIPDSSVILRTAWLYGHPGKSFVHTIVKAGQEREFLEVVDDQIGQPTWATDVASMIDRIVTADVPSGLFHATNSGQASWFDFAQEIFRRAGWDPERVRPTVSEKFPRPAKRPAWSVLGHAAWEKKFSWQPRHWTVAFSDAWSTEMSWLVSGTSESD